MNSDAIGDHCMSVDKLRSNKWLFWDGRMVEAFTLLPWRRLDVEDHFRCDRRPEEQFVIMCSSSSRCEKTLSGSRCAARVHVPVKE